jgi:choline dehydrogenase-like flavoprotein
MAYDGRYDIIIIGSGAGGGTFARAIADSGLRVLIVERGEYIPRERENWDTREVFANRRYLARETWYDADDQPFSPYTHYCVGGNTKMYGAALLRLREHDFGVVRHHGGESPAWPLGYDEFEPWYTLAERLYAVHGERGADPFEPPASGPYPHPALEPEPRIARLRDDLAAAGYSPFPAPLGLRLNEHPRGGAPVRLSNFDGYPDPTEVKADAHVVGVRPALHRSSVDILTGAFVEKLVTDASGRDVREVHAVRGDERLVLRAGVVVLAAGAINSAALLLRSASGRFPRGLANSSDQVGRNYMAHHNGVLLAVTQELNPSVFQKYLALTDLYRREPGGELPLGLVQLMGKPDPDTIAWVRGDALAWVDLEHIAARTIDFFLSSEDLPHPDNRVSLRPDGSIRLSVRPTNLVAYERLVEATKRAITAAERVGGRPEPVYLHARLGISGVSHQNGTLRFGTDPRTSVLDINCRAHDLDNLYVVDGSFFPSCGAVNPSLTIMANALRVATHVQRRAGCVPTGRSVECTEGVAC